MQCICGNILTNVLSIPSALAKPLKRLCLLRFGITKCSAIKENPIGFTYEIFFGISDRFRYGQIIAFKE